MKKLIGIIGLGLLGGSMAKALHEYTDYSVVGYARRQEICDMALADGVVDAAFTNIEDMLAVADVLVFSLPPDTNARLFEKIAPKLRPGMIITDVSSAKKNFVEAVHAHIPEGVFFVSLHPMAGSEKGGYEMATADLFQGATWIVLEEAHPSFSEEIALEFEEMGKAFGSRIERVKLSEHDSYLARVSHMPHLIASMVAMVAGSDEKGEFRMRLAAGGFRDVTRVAGGNPSMWREIIKGNDAEVSAALAEMAKEIVLVQELLSRDDEGASVEAYLAHAKEVRDRFSEIYKK